MFTGLVQACAPLLELRRAGAGAVLRLAQPDPAWALEPGESISVSGACLSVSAQPPGAIEFELSAETLARTHLGRAQPGRLLNLERALRPLDRLGGHFVSGHVDGLGRVSSVEGGAEGGWTYVFEAPAGFERYLVDKGSVAVDGVSLTVVAPAGRRFQCALIPLTFRGTSLGRARPGDEVHLEADLLAKYVERLLPARA